MNDDSAAQLFEQHRVHLTGVAYRMLGSIADAEDAVQEGYLRFARSDIESMRDVRGWLTTTIGRICLDELGSARARRENYIGPWLPEPVVRPAVQSPPLGPEDQVTLDESVSMAMLVLLESLTPAERTAFVLHDVLGLAYDEVSNVVGRAEPACRQLVSRARAHLRRRSARFTPDAGEHSRVVEAFRVACDRGSLDDLVSVLDPDVVLRSDGGGQVAGVARQPVAGAENVARLLLGVAARSSTYAAGVAEVNGATGIVVEDAGQVVGVMGFAVADGLISEIFFVLNPDKLRRVSGRAGGDR
jgi:RNA polymerase sigma-70 factor (ECF subfamily)